MNLSVNVGDKLLIKARKTVSEIDTEGHSLYLGFDEVNNKISTVYVCFTKSEKEYCLKWVYSSVYKTNFGIIQDVFNGEDGCFFSTNLLIVTIKVYALLQSTKV